MKPKHAARAVRALKIHCPVDRPTWDLLMAGKIAAIDPTSDPGRIIRLIREDNPLGDFGTYRSVIEVTPGWEIFTPAPGARPTLGTEGIDAVSPTAILTVYIPTDAAPGAVADAIDAIVEAHPWEVPVIEIAETFLVTRGRVVRSVDASPAAPGSAPRL